MKNNRLDRLIRVFRHRDKLKGWVCDLDVKYVHNLQLNGCYYCGSHLELGLDRIDNNQGHTKSNVLSCCKLCNNTKRHIFSPEDFKKIVSFCISNNIYPYSGIYSPFS